MEMAEEKQKKPKKTIGEWIAYILVTIVVFVITWCACDILINSNTWYIANVDESEIYSVTVTYSDGETFYDNVFILHDPAYETQTQELLDFIDNRTPHNAVAQCLLRNQQRLLQIPKFFQFQGSDYNEEFRVFVTTEDEVNKEVAFTDENREDFIDYILNTDFTPEEVYEIQ